MKTEPNKTVDNKTATENTPNTPKTAAKKTVDLAKEKAELKEQIKKEKPVHNLEATLEVLANLQTKMRQRRRLLETVEKLENFVVETEKDEDEMGAGMQFQSCGLLIEDDSRNKFKTNNPVVIEAVTKFIKDMCINRLADIEATIVLP